MKKLKERIKRIYVTLMCKYTGHDSKISFTPNKESPSGYYFYRHCIRCREILDEGHALL